MERITKKLLPNTIRIYVIFATFVLLAAAPLFYFTTQWLYVNDTIETLTLTKKSFIKNTLPRLDKKDIPAFNRMNWNMHILPFEEKINSDIFQLRSFPDSIENEDETYRVLLTPVRIEDQYYTLMIRMNMIESENLVESIAIVFIFIIIVFFIGFYIIVRRYAKKMWEPFYSALHQIEAFEIDKNNLPQWPSTNIEEFIRLNEAVNILINRNIEIYKRQKEFVENASHELQTPLAAFQAKLDTLMQMPGITSAQATIIDDLLHTVLRLTRLNKNLLLLSKLDRNMFPETEEISLNKALLRQLSFFMQQADMKNITIEYQFLDEVFVVANASLLDSLLSNLLLNAIRYNYSGGNVKVIIEGRTLSIQNTGKDEVLDTYRIFERFAKLDSNSKGNGLGLAIVKKIATFYTWQLNYCKKDGHHCFILKF